MNRHLQIVVFIFALGAPVLVFAQADRVALHLEPSTDAPVYYREDRGLLERLDPQLWEADTRWSWVEYPGTFVGYVPTTRVTKGGTVRRGTLVHLRPQPESPVLTRLDESTAAHLIRSQGAWSSVYYAGMAPVYFLNRQPPETASPPPPSTQPTPAPTATSPQRETSPATAPPPSAETEVTIIGLRDAQGDGPVEPTPEEGGIVVGELGPAPAPSEAPPGSRFFSGVVREASALDRLFHPSQRFVLENSAGEKVAFLDFSRARIDRTAGNFVGRQVSLTGQATRIRGSIPLRVDVRTITLTRP